MMLHKLVWGSIDDVIVYENAIGAVQSPQCMILEP